MTVDLTHEAFAKHLHTTFRTRVNDSVNIETELTEVSEHKVSAQQDGFAIIFRGPSEAFLGQGLRQFEHDQMGAFELFIVPISQDEKGFYYEAVFNRLTQND
jgi:hypothetical protein